MMPDFPDGLVSAYPGYGPIQFTGDNTYWMFNYCGSDIDPTNMTRSLCFEKANSLFDFNKLSQMNEWLDCVLPSQHWGGPSYEQCYISYERKYKKVLLI